MSARAGYTVALGDGLAGASVSTFAEEQEGFPVPWLCPERPSCTDASIGAALGAVGWWMVASGLSDRVSVSQYRLAFHLTLACVIFGAVLWTAQNLIMRAPVAAPGRIRASALVLLAVFAVSAANLSWRRSARLR